MNETIATILLFILTFAVGFCVQYENMLTTDNWDMDGIAKDCYKLAEAMIAEKARREGE